MVNFATYFHDYGRVLLPNGNLGQKMRVHALENNVTGYGFGLTEPAKTGYILHRFHE